MALLILGTTGCSEIYYPKVMSKNDFLVVDGLITNTNGPFVIKLSKAVKYSADSVTDADPVTQANLTITDNNNVSYAMTETSPGKYTTPSSLVSRVGNSYKLQIKTADGNTYESDYQKLTRPVSYDSIKYYNVTEGFLDSYKSLSTTTGADIRIDLSDSSSVEKIKYKFTTNLTLQCMYIAAQAPYYEWITDLPLENDINITDESSSSSDNSITNHKIGFIPFSVAAFPDEWHLPRMQSLADFSYYLKINQYTLNDASFVFYQAAKKQLSASGKIFDPIASQLYGNIKCTNNPSKLAFGFFEASSITTYAIFIFKRDEKMVSEKVPYIDIPEPTSTTNNTTRPPRWWGHGIL
jgi:hypothetical protein